MNWLRALTTRANKNILGEIVSYLLVTAIAIRGLAEYPDTRLQIASLLVIFILITLAEPLFRRPKLGQALFLFGQIGVMLGLFRLTPVADYWAIMLLPACSYVMRHHRQRIAWAWIVIFIAAMAIMNIIAQGWANSAEFIIIYIAAYSLMGSYALILKQMDSAQAESQRLLHELQHSNVQLQEYIVQVEELAAIKERNRLARELHDAVTQSIFSMTLITRSALILQEREPAQVRDKLLQLQGLAHDALQEMRSLIYQLRTYSVEEDGLYPVLQKYIDGVNGRDDLYITLDSESETLPLLPVQQQELYRIIQEAVNNVIKHARASKVVIRFEVTETAVTVTISDDGGGFEAARLKKNGAHIGLDSMRERAAEIGGTLSINSGPGVGTDIIVNVPVTEQRASDE